jgi:hypothetical protein
LPLSCSKEHYLGKPDLSPLISQRHTCRNCGHVFTGKVCNNCGEKTFNEHQLSTSHFFHQIIDFFTHFENKVLRSIWLNFIKPGFITKQNLSGVRVRYATPVQLYLVVSIIFFIVVTKIGVTDYTPSPMDHYYFKLSDYAPFKWVEPLDNSVIDGIDSMRVHKHEEIAANLIAEANERDSAGLVKYYALHRADSISLSSSQLNVIAGEESRQIFWANFQSHISSYSKTLIFLTLPFIAGIFFLFFFKRLKMYGASLILATHFMVYNLCFFILHSVIDMWPKRIFSTTHVPNLMDPFRWLFTNETTAPVAQSIFGSTFEFLHLLFWMPWLIIAFNRLFHRPWWVNVIVAYICSRIFFYLIFGVMKKFLIAFTIWTMH